MSEPIIETRTFVVYLAHGLTTEEIIREVPKRSPELHAQMAPKRADAFFYADIVSATIRLDGMPIETTSQRRNLSVTYYIDTKLYNYEALDSLSLPGYNLDCLRDRMRCGGVQLVVQSRNRSNMFWPYIPGQHQLVSSVQR